LIVAKINTIGMTITKIKVWLADGIDVQLGKAVSQIG
jgi:hypothetical protein